MADISEAAADFTVAGTSEAADSVSDTLSASPSGSRCQIDHRSVVAPTWGLTGQAQFCLGKRTGTGLAALRACSVTRPASPGRYGPFQLQLLIAICCCQDGHPSAIVFV